MDKMQYLKMKNKQKEDFNERRKLLKIINPNIIFDDGQYISSLSPSFINSAIQNHGGESNEEQQRRIREGRNRLRNMEKNRINENNNNKIVNKIETRRIVNVEKLTEDKKLCFLCKLEFNNGEKFFSLPCAHFFHAHCIRDWIERKRTCPICLLSISART